MHLGSAFLIQVVVGLIFLFQEFPLQVQLVDFGQMGEMSHFYLSLAEGVDLTPLGSPCERPVHDIDDAQRQSLLTNKQLFDHSFEDSFTTGTHKISSSLSFSSPPALSSSLKTTVSTCFRIFSFTSVCSLPMPASASCAEALSIWVTIVATSLLWNSSILKKKVESMIFLISRGSSAANIRSSSSASGSSIIFLRLSPGLMFCWRRGAGGDTLWSWRNSKMQSNYREQMFSRTMGSGTVYSSPESLSLSPQNISRQNWERDLRIGLDILQEKPSLVRMTYILFIWESEASMPMA